MLSDKIKDILMEHARFANPGQDQCEWCGFMAYLVRCERHSTFLDACGHDTQELAGANARTEVAVQELKHVNECISEQFKKDPFPFTKPSCEHVPLL
jgi:hypothetical protein